MLVQSLLPILEAAKAEPDAKRFTGNVGRLEEAFSSEGVIALEKMHNGIFAVLAFHPGLDVAVKDYVTADSALAIDSGPRIFVIFTLALTAIRPNKVNDSVFRGDITIDRAQHPAYEFVWKLFPKERTKLPGLVLVECLSGISEPVFVSLCDQDLAGVAKTLRLVFAHATEAYDGSRQSEVPGGFVDKLCLNLAVNNIEYLRTSSPPVLEVLVRVFHALKRNLSDLVSIVKLFK